jgi:hypothetical protein
MTDVIDIHVTAEAVARTSDLLNLISHDVDDQL